MKILKKTIASDLYYLFISKPWFASDFMVRLLEYNPDMFKPTDGHEPSPRNFIRLLSDDEIKAVKDTTQRSLQSVKDSYEWLEENYPECAIPILFFRKSLTAL
ncbi:hypothetical protein AN958_03149 [Leucoagaricus sp. SymC.cos]|nr:hypothetical protein AN958_03149 [Leucoagaricus sp. SymC.cos]